MGHTTYQLLNKNNIGGYIGLFGFSGNVVKYMPRMPRMPRPEKSSDIYERVGAVDFSGYMAVTIRSVLILMVRWGYSGVAWRPSIHRKHMVNSA